MAAVKFQQIGEVYSVRFRYDPTLVELIELIPRQGRRWDVDGKQWIVAEHYAAELARDLAAAAGHTIIGFDQPQPPTNDSDWAAALFRRVGPTRCDAVFRALTRMLHPDAATGSNGLQQELIAAREGLR